MYALVEICEGGGEKEIDRVGGGVETTAWQGVGEGRARVKILCGG